MEQHTLFEFDGLPGVEMAQLMEFAYQYQQTMLLYEAGIREVKTKLDALSEQSRILGRSNPIESIKSRIKEPRSIVKKLKRRELPISLQSMVQNLHDIGGIRIICPFIADIYTVEEMLLCQEDLTLIEKKDYIRSPKPNGYRSLHMIVEVPIFLFEATSKVRIELQIRTIAMDFWASLEHQLRYKAEAETPVHVVKDLREIADIIAATDMKMQEISNKLNNLENKGYV